MSADSGAAPRGRRPGVGFPTFPLNEAALAVKRAGAYGYQHSVDALAGYMNHSTTNSGAFRAKAAALRDYGLISGRGEVIQLTELAQAIAHPESAAAEQEAARSAFFTAEVFAKLHDIVAKGVDLDLEHLGNAAVRTLGVNAAAKTAFIESFVAGAVFSGVAVRVDDRHVRLLSRDAALAHGDAGEAVDVPVENPPVAAVAVPLAPPVAISPQAAAVPPTVHQRWVVPDGEVRFEIVFDRPLPATAFPHIARVVEECERLAGLLESFRPAAVIGAPASDHEVWTVGPAAPGTDSDAAPPDE
jgi:hypothetical protein